MLELRSQTFLRC